MARDPEAPPARLYLITPPLEAASPFDRALAAALAAGDVACVLARFATTDPSQRKAILRTLTPLAQDHGAALLVDGDAQLAARAGADGAHVAGAGQALDEAIESLKPERIVGVGHLATRDECMEAGERDVDYLMFGGPADPATSDDILERTQWWAEIFNVPCVAFARSLDEVEALADAGAEFIALDAAVWDDARGPAAAVSEASARSVGAVA
ncbi:MAG TPA: thiamine phosphate synthase [Rhodoblastus sp.]|nr:thiamine phosphate synthase [Rhodoblastus sp.]